MLAPFAIAPGSYQFTRYRLEAQTSSPRPLQFGTTTWFGSFYDGQLTQWQNYLKWRSPKGRVQPEADVENDFGHLPQGNFVQRLWQLQGAYAWSPNLVLSSFIQYDTESQNVGTSVQQQTRHCCTSDQNRFWHFPAQQDQEARERDDRGSDVIN